jgi:hypothetical protein
VGPRTSRDEVMETKIPSPCRDSNPRSSIPYRSALPLSYADSTSSCSSSNWSTSKMSLSKFRVHVLHFYAVMFSFYFSEMWLSWQTRYLNQYSAWFMGLDDVGSIPERGSEEIFSSRCRVQIGSGPHPFHLSSGYRRSYCLGGKTAGV